MGWQEDIDTSRTDVWRYARLFAIELPDEARICLGDTAAPLISLDAGTRNGPLRVLREDLKPNGSH